MLSAVMYMILAAAGVGTLILVHELGHFLAAKAVGVRVEVFSIGFWKTIVSFRRGDTEYRLAIIPLGGYVRMAGEVEGEGTGASDELCSKTPGQRALVFVAGVVMNALLAVVGFIVAFTVGVPFAVAEIGRLSPGWPAWEAGLREGDQIVRINDREDPDFEDIFRTVALGGQEDVAILVKRNGQDRPIPFTVATRYDPIVGVKRIGFQPPILTLVAGLAKVGGEDGRSPAEEAGIEVGDRILAINGKEVQYWRHVNEELRKYPNDWIQIELQRGERTLNVKLRTEPRPQYGIGISGVSATIESLQGDGMAMHAGLTVGDRIVSVTGKTPPSAGGDLEIRSIVELEHAVREAFGPTELTVERGGEGRVVQVDIPDEATLEEFLFSLTCYSSNEMTWIRPGGPADRAGMKPGDTIVDIAGSAVENWLDIMAAAVQSSEPRSITWVRDGRTSQAEVTSENNLLAPLGSLGCVFDRPKTRVRRYGVLGAARLGAEKTVATFAELFLTLRGFASRDVSTKNVGGIVIIAYSAYHAARQGIGKLIYLMSIISAALAFLNVLPIPVLDGGHLMFLAIEKVRGKPVGERIRMVSQFIGLALLLLLVAYTVRNDIMRLR